MMKKDEKVVEYLEREAQRAKRAEECDDCDENKARSHEIDNVKAVVTSILKKNPVFTFEKVHPDAKLPVRAHPTDAGWDVFACEPCCIRGGSVGLVTIGLKCCIPEGWEIQVRCRGSMARQGFIVANSPGTVDSGYRGEIKVIIANLKDGNYEANDLMINKGDKIAQLIFSPTYDITLLEGEVKQDSDRNSNAFGSTGK